MECNLKEIVDEKAVVKEVEFEECEEKADGNQNLPNCKLESVAIESIHQRQPVLVGSD